MAKDININVRKKMVNLKVVDDDLVVKKVENIDMDFRIERQDDPKAFYCGPAPVPEKAKSRDVIKNEISEKARITYYIIDKIFADPKPGTTMTINNDASIEFKF